jgi:hypothetical protein
MVMGNDEEKGCRPWKAMEGKAYMGHRAVQSTNAGDAHTLHGEILGFLN